MPPLSLSHKVKHVRHFSDRFSVTRSVVDLDHARQFLQTCLDLQGLAIMVFVTDNEASTHAVNLAVALHRPDVDTIHIMHACTNDGAAADAQKLMARLTQGLGPKVNSEVTVSCLRCCTLLLCI